MKKTNKEVFDKKTETEIENAKRRIKEGKFLTETEAKKRLNL